MSEGNGLPLSLARAIVEQNLLKPRPWRFDAQGQLVVQDALRRVTESALDDQGEVLLALRRLTRGRGAPTLFAAAIGVSDEMVLGTLRGTRAPTGKVLAACGFERVVAYRRLPTKAREGGSSTAEPPQNPNDSNPSKGEKP